jgi:TetR/AcrR family transcriptional regulator
MNIRSSTAGAVRFKPRRERERQQRRADILRAAEVVFGEYGFHAASIEQIATAAEFATGTVYLYFRDKEALYIELFEEKVRELSDLIHERTTNVADPIRALQQLVTARMDFFERNRSFFRLYAREGLDPHEIRTKSWAGVLRLYAKYLKHLAGLIRLGQQRRLFRKGDPHQFAVALSGMMIHLTRERLQGRRSEPLTDLTSFVLDLFLKGAGAKATTERSHRRLFRYAC